MPIRMWLLCSGQSVPASCRLYQIFLAPVRCLRPPGPFTLHRGLADALRSTVSLLDCSVRSGFPSPLHALKDAALLLSLPKTLFPGLPGFPALCRCIRTGDVTEVLPAKASPLPLSFTHLPWILRSTGHISLYCLFCILHLRAGGFQAHLPPEQHVSNACWALQPLPLRREPRLGPCSCDRLSFSIVFLSMCRTAVVCNSQCYGCCWWRGGLPPLALVGFSVQLQTVRALRLSHFSLGGRTTGLLFWPPPSCRELLDWALGLQVSHTAWELPVVPEPAWEACHRRYRWAWRIREPPSLHSDGWEAWKQSERSGPSLPQQQGLGIPGPRLGFGLAWFREARGWRRRRALGWILIYKWLHHRPAAAFAHQPAPQHRRGTVQWGPLSHEPLQSFKADSLQWSIHKQPPFTPQQRPLWSSLRWPWPLSDLFLRGDGL